jgi:hypothetical protein
VKVFIACVSCHPELTLWPDDGKEGTGIAEQDSLFCGRPSAIVDG